MSLCSSSGARSRGCGGRDGTVASGGAHVAGGDGEYSGGGGHAGASCVSAAAARSGSAAVAAAAAVGAVADGVGGAAGGAMGTAVGGAAAAAKGGGRRGGHRLWRGWYELCGRVRMQPVMLWFHPFSVLALHTGQETLDTDPTVPDACFNASESLWQTGAPPLICLIPRTHHACSISPWQLRCTPSCPSRRPAPSPWQPCSCPTHRTCQAPGTRGGLPCLQVWDVWGHAQQAGRKDQRARLCGCLRVDLLRAEGASTTANTSVRHSSPGRLQSEDVAPV